MQGKRVIRRISSSFLIVLSLLVGSVRADATDTEGVRAFFARYVAVSDAYDETLVDLYSDSAVIRSYRRYPHGLERSMELSGSQWKALMAKALPLAKAQADRSTYSDVAVVLTGRKAKITASRYSLRKCYTDTGYFMIVERQPNGSYLIVEEYSETQPQSSC